MAVEYGLPANVYIEYDGSNSADVLAAVQAHWAAASIVSEVDGVLTISSGYSINDPQAVSMGERFGVYTWDAVSAADWAAKYVKA